MFAASLKTLQKRATTLASEVVQGLDNVGKKKAEGLDELGPVGFEVQQSARQFVAAEHQGKGLTDVPSVVRYEVQNADEGDREAAAFPLPAPPGGSITVGHVRKHFPLPGRYHFRFKAASVGGAFGGHIWIDLASDAEVVPTFRGEICIKTLQLPDGAGAPRALEPLPGSLMAAAVAASAPGLTSAASPLGASPCSSASPRGSSPSASPPPPAYRPPAAQQASPSSSQRPHSPQSPPSHAPAAQPAQPQIARPPEDLLFGFGEPQRPAAGSQQAPAGMSAGMSAGMPAGMPAGMNFSSSPSPPPARQFDRQQLVAEREARERAQVEEAVQRQMETQQKEAQQKADKLEQSNKLASELERWAKTSDGQAYKDIQVLLSSLHTVLWPGTEWQELPLSKLISSANEVKKWHRKAIIICHPDKQSGAGAEQQARADRIFAALNEAWKVHQAKQG